MARLSEFLNIALRRTPRRFRSRGPAVAAQAIVLFLLLAMANGCFAQGGLASPIFSRTTSKNPAEERSLNFRMKLPYPAGTTFEVYQGNHGTFSHNRFNEYAWDFGMDEGQPVCAVATGRVVRIKQDSSRGGPTPENFGAANTVILDHGGGLFSQYLHLKKDSVTVAEGELVQAGKTIALSGNTGYSTIPHLHFQLQDATGQSLPAKFLEITGDGVPQQNSTYTSQNDGQGTSPFRGDSIMPRDCFARNSVELLASNFPAHLLKLGSSYRVEGRVLSRAQKLVVFLMAPEGGRALYSVLIPVEPSGRFSATVKFDGIADAIKNWSPTTSQSNSFALAIAPVDHDGSYWSNFSIPVCLR